MSNEIVKKPLAFQVPPEGGLIRTGTGIDLHVRYHRPTPESLAVQMAEAMNKAYLAQQDYHVLMQQVERERSKMRELKNLREKVRMRDLLRQAGRDLEYKGRMDPMRTYTAEALTQNIEGVHENLQIIEQNAEARRKTAVAAKAVADKLHRQIQEMVAAQRKVN